MKIGMLGTGIVGQNIASKLVELGHQVLMGSRDKANSNAMEWAGKQSGNALYGTFADAAAFGDIVINCTNGAHSIEALKLAGQANLQNKILIDISNPLKFQDGLLGLFVSNTDSLGEQIQRTFPEAKVVKTLNTVNIKLQVNPSVLAEEHAVFVSGNEQEAKQTVIQLLQSFGWKSIIDLGDIKTARGAEAMMLIWWPLYQRFPNEYFNYKIVRSKQ